MENHKLANLKYSVDGMEFDAAIDIHRILHAYNDMPKNVVPVEIYCISHSEWDIWVFYSEHPETNGFVNAVYLKEILRENHEFIDACKH